MNTPEETPDLYDFRLLVAEKDRSGYYVTRWDQAQRMTIRAATKAAAIAKITVVLGACRSGFTWVGRIEDITPVAASLEVPRV